MYSPEEEQRLKAIIGAPLSGIQYQTGEQAPAPLQVREQPGVGQQLVTSYATGKAVQGIDKGVGMVGNQFTSQAPAPVKDLSTASTVVDGANVVPTNMAPLAEAPVELTGQAITGEVAQTGLMDAGIAGAADASAGMTASTAGPLAGVVEYARTGDVKKGVGAGAGAAAGAVAGNMVLPGVGGYVGSVIGSQLGSAVGGK